MERDREWVLLETGVGDSAERCGGHTGGVLCEHATAIPGLRALPLGETVGDFLLGKAEGESAGDGVDGDRVAVFDNGQRTAIERLGVMWPTTKPCVPPEKRPSVMSATSLPRPRPITALVGESISRMPGPPRGPS